MAIQLNLFDAEDLADLAAYYDHLIHEHERQQRTRPQPRAVRYPPPLYYRPAVRTLDDWRADPVALVSDRLC